MPRASGLVVAAVMLAACGTADPPVDLEAHPVQFAHALCATLFRCCALPGSRDQLVRWSGNPPSQAFCEDAVAQSLADRVPHLQESLGAGRISYSESATRACLTEMEKLRCEDFSWSNAFPTTGCWAVAGRVLTSGACVDNVECVQGRCNFTSGGIGACVTVPGPGERCQAACRPGLMCEGVCVPQVSKTAGAVCDSNSQCRSRLCGPEGTSTTLTCAPVQACGFFP
jgi:hypothetical protein